MPRAIRHLPSAIFVSLCVLCASAVISRADDGWSLTTADFKRQTVNLRALDDTGVKVIPFGQTTQTTIPLEQFLQLDRAGSGNSSGQALRGDFALYLASGDRIGGRPVAIANDQVTWRSPAAGELSIPLASVRGIQRGQETPAFDAARTEDVVFLANGDNVKGIVTGLEGDKVNVKQASGDVLPVDLATAKAIHFASATAATAGNASARAFRVQLTDGSVVTAPKVELAGAKLALDFGGQGGKPRPIDPAQVVLIEQLNGPVSWLSARTPKESVYHPMFDVAFPPQMDRDYRGQRIKFGGRDYARGIGVHAYCRLTYALDGTKGGFKVFRTQYALDEDAHKGKVTVRILLDDKVVHEVRDFPPGKLSPVVVLDLGDARTLTLEAHPGGDAATDDRTRWHIDTQARLNWIEPALLKEKPAAPEAPKPEAPKTDTPAEQ